MWGEGRPGLRADYRAFPSRSYTFQIDNVVGLGDQPGDFQMKRCFPSEINGCYYSLTFSPSILKALFSLAQSTVSKVVERQRGETNRIQCTFYKRMEKLIALRGISWHGRTTADYAMHFTINKAWGSCIIHSSNNAVEYVHWTHTLIKWSSGVYICFILYLLVCLCTLPD